MVSYGVSIEIYQGLQDTAIRLCCICIATGLLGYLLIYEVSFEQLLFSIKIGLNLTRNNATNSTVFHDFINIDFFENCPFEPPDPWHKSIVKYINVKHGFLKDCEVNESTVPVTELNNSRVLLKEGNEEFKCQGRCLLYLNDYSYQSTEWTPANDTEFYCDFVETHCVSPDNETNRFIHMQILGEKSLPRTINLLKQGMMAVEFRKLNKVGSHSRPNAFPLLFGKILEHVDKKPFNLSSIPADWSYDYFCNSYLDNESFIPFEYRDAGYKILSGEDYMSSVLYWPDCYGMEENRFHHSFRPFYTRLDEDPDLYNIHTKGSCRLQHNNVLDYLSLFLKAYEGLPKFSLVWLGELAHDDAADLYGGDYDLYDFFLKHKDALENSFTFVLGDHGLRFGSEAQASTSADANNPFLYIVLPKIHRLSKLHEQLLENSQEIVTHHDLHSTLKDILYFQPEAMFTDLEFKRFDSDPHGSSLLRKFEPGVNRTCKTLPIPFQFCICQYKKKIITQHEKVVALGKFAAAGIASILESYNVSSQCEKIAMYKVFIVEEYISQNTSTSNATYFDIKFSVAKPAKGQFKILIREDEYGNLELASDIFQRLSPYGHNGDCMSVYLLKPLCTCRKPTTVLLKTTSPKKSLPMRINATTKLPGSTSLLRSSSTRTNPTTMLHKSTSSKGISSSPRSKSLSSHLLNATLKFDKVSSL